MLRSFSLLLLVLSCLNGLAQAQPDNASKAIRQRAYLGANLGLSIPVGKFSTNFEDDLETGFAKNGFSLNYLDAGYRIAESFGAKFTLFNTTNDLDFDLLRRSRSDHLERNYLTAKGTNYELDGFLIGVSDIKVEKDYDLSINFMLGYARFFIPQVELEFIDANSGERQLQSFSAENEAGFGAALSLDFYIHMNSYLDFTSNLGYSIFENNFNQTINTNQQQESIEFNLSHEVIRLNFGLAYRFIQE